MENDDFSKVVRAFDDKTEPASRFFMPDNFYDEKANIINDFETVRKEHFVGDPALRPKDGNLSFNATNIKDNSMKVAGVDNSVKIDMGSSFVNNSNNVAGDTDSVFSKLVNSNSGGGFQSVTDSNVHSINVDVNTNTNVNSGSNGLGVVNNNIDTSELFSPKFVETGDSANSTFVSDNSSVLNNQDFSNETNSFSNVVSAVNKGVIDNNSVDVSINNEKPEVSSDDNVYSKSSNVESDMESTNINKILSNTLGVTFTTDESASNQDNSGQLYEDLKPAKFDTSNKISGLTLDSNFMTTTNNDFVDKTISSHKEFSNLDLGRDFTSINNQDNDIEQVSGFSHTSQWHDIPRSVYKAASVNVPVIIDDSTSVSVPTTGPKVFNNVISDDAVINDVESSDNKVSINDDDSVTMDSKNDVQSWINRILKVDNNPVKINADGSIKSVDFNDNNSSQRGSNIDVNNDKSTAVGDIEKFTKKEVDYDFSVKNLPVHKSDLLVGLEEKQERENKISILVRYGEDFCSRDYITNPAIGRSNEIKQLILILLTPEKSGILVGKPGIGKTSIVEGLAYQLQRDNVPDALKGYTIVNVKTASLLGTLPSGETRLQTLIDELKDLEKVILFIDEIHMLIGATNESALDFANMFKEGLGRGKIKVIGATTTEEYERYILRDKAFVRRFQKVEVLEPSREHTIRILMGTLPKIEKTTNAKLKYDSIIQGRIMGFIVDITSEYKRIYGIGSRYPDICLTLLSQAFSQAVFDDRKEVNIFDIRNAIENSKNIYPDVIRKELQRFDKMFENVIREEQGLPPLEENGSRF